MGSYAGFMVLCIFRMLGGLGSDSGVGGLTEFTSFFFLLTL